MRYYSKTIAAIVGFSGSGVAVLITWDGWQKLWAVALLAAAAGFALAVHEDRRRSDRSGSRQEVG